MFASYVDSSPDRVGLNTTPPFSEITQNWHGSKARRLFTV